MPVQTVTPIDGYLADILAAVYGEQVRGSIHDAIRSMWNDLNYAVQHQLIDLDATLTHSGSGADAAAVGEKLANVFSNKGDLPNSTYLNTVTEHGYYRLVGSRQYGNKPTGFNTSGLLLVFVGGSYIFQMLYHYTGSDDDLAVGYIRRYESSVWSDWKPTVDKTLTMVGVPAEAKAVGDLIAESLEPCFKSMGDLPNGTYLDVKADPGYYRLLGSYTYYNLPTGFNTAGFLIIYTIGSYIYQRLYHFSGSPNLAQKYYVRRFDSNERSWDNWICNIDNTLSITGQAADAKAVGDALGEMESTIEEIRAIVDYIPIEIKGFAVNPATVELGRTIDSVLLSFTCNTVPKTLTIDGQSIAPRAVGQETRSVSLTSSKTFTLTATDNGSPSASPKTVTKTATISFLNAAYWGVAKVPDEINSGFVLGLSQKELTSTRIRSFSVSAGNPGNERYIWYAVPTNLGTCRFTVGGFEGGFEPAEVVTVMNSFDHQETYYVYRSTYDGLGDTVVSVS